MIGRLVLDVLPSWQILRYYVDRASPSGCPSGRCTTRIALLHPSGTHLSGAPMHLQKKRERDEDAEGEAPATEEKSAKKKKKKDKSEAADGDAAATPEPAKSEKKKKKKKEEG